VNALTIALSRWVETIANESAQLDVLTLKRLRMLTGRSIRFEMGAGDTTTVNFESDRVRLGVGSGDRPSVIVRGTPVALASAFIGAGKSGGISIEGDETVLEQFRGIVRDFRPDLLLPLQNLVGIPAAETITSLFEVGVSALSAVGRALGDEGSRLARRGAGQRYLTKPDFDAFIDTMRALRVRIDRLDVRANIVERTRGGDE
jgi:ubiquinone biosynthesis protein UbiJ